MLFVKLPYTLATEEAERIGLDHVARLVLNGVKIYTGCIKLVVSRLYLKPHKYHTPHFINIVLKYFIFTRIVSSTDGGESR